MVRMVTTAAGVATRGKGRSWIFAYILLHIALPTLADSSREFRINYARIRERREKDEKEAGKKRGRGAGEKETKIEGLEGKKITDGKEEANLGGRTKDEAIN
ncbi:hypothetical protein AAMO2058_001403000, partial [Amorphochlora amoebiformis]